MSSAIIRRNSSKQGLQNLLRMTAQRSIEDAEEIERERRRRARESFRSGSQTGTESPSQDHSPTAEDGLFENELKPAWQPALEEDEGFSDWTQKLERHRQRRLEGQGYTEEEPEGRRGHTGRWEREQAAVTEEEKPRVEEPVEEQRRKAEDKLAPPEKKEMKVSYTSKVFLQQEVKHMNGDRDTAQVEVAALNKTKRLHRNVSQAAEGEEEAEVFLETEQKLEKIRRSHQEKESQELEQLRQRQAEAEVELEELKRKREERRKLREEEEKRRAEEEHQRQIREEEEKRRMKEDIERRRMEAAERRMKTLSTSSTEGDEPFSPISPKNPTFKNESDEKMTAEHSCSITERTESLNRSLKKSNSIKKTQPPVLITRIDDRLEQYSHAIETSSKEPKGTKQAAMDITSPPEPVSTKRSLFEAGETLNQSFLKGPPSKDADGLKVGVADLIHQWVKGNPDGTSRNSPSKPSDVKAGDVLHKKNLWENIGDSSSIRRSGPGGKGTPSGKRYKFVVTGHGKYEKIPVDDEGDYTNDDFYHGES